MSVPAIYFFALFRNRVIYISNSVMLTADQFLRHFSHAGRSKGSVSARRRPPSCRTPRPCAESIGMSRLLSTEVKAEPNLTPILDMVFQLITFFMLVINFKSAEVDLCLKLPVVGSARPVDSKGQRDLLVLNIEHDGQLEDLRTLDHEHRPLHSRRGPGQHVGRADRPRPIWKQARTCPRPS